MPVFEYNCNRCGIKFDEWVRSKDQEVECPVCKSNRVEKLFSSFATGKSDCATASGGT
jgi:putative FmdB family regulatory protein